MSLLRPDARVRGAAASVRAGEPPPEDPLDRALYLALHPEPPEPADPHVADAVDLYRSPYHHVLDALIITRAPAAEVCAALDIPTEVYDAYATACFDVRVFRHVFALRHYIKTLERDASEEFKSYDLALQEGYDALLDRYRISDWPDLDPKRATMRLAREFLLRSREHRALGLTNPIAKESLKAARAALDACAQLHAMTADRDKKNSATEELILALQPRELTHAVGAGPVDPADLIRTGPADPKRD